MIVRESTQVGELKEHPYQHGDFFFIGVHQIHRHPNYWPHPLDLDLKNQARKSIAFMPYGYGKRHCIGARLADQELQLILKRILQSYVLKAPEGNTPIDTKVMITAYPASPVQISFTRR